MEAGESHQLGNAMRTVSAMTLNPDFGLPTQIEYVFKNGKGREQMCTP